MSAHTEHTPHGAADAHDHEHHADDDDGHDDSGASHSTLKGYMTGFILAVVLTAIPFWLVMGKVFESSSTTALVLMAFAAVQIVVHMIYFLHMNTRSEGGWSFLALLFTLLIVGIALAGSLWVMYHMNANMMPMSVHDMKNMP
jgi:cytochrome o ubiquinol oxidase operon protein cyoD